MLRISCTKRSVCQPVLWPPLFCVTTATIWLTLRVRGLQPASSGSGRRKEVVLGEENPRLEVVDRRFRRPTLPSFRLLAIRLRALIVFERLLIQRRFQGVAAAPATRSEQRQQSDCDRVRSDAPPSGHNPGEFPAADAICRRNVRTAAIKCVVGFGVSIRWSTPGECRSTSSAIPLALQP